MQHLSTSTIDDIQINGINGNRQQIEDSDSLNNNSAVNSDNRSSSKASKFAKLGAGALAWSAVKVVRTTAVAIFGLGVGVGLILGDSLRSEERAVDSHGSAGVGRTMSVPYQENSLPAQ